MSENMKTDTDEIFEELETLTFEQRSSLLCMLLGFFEKKETNSSEEIFNVAKSLISIAKTKVSVGKTRFVKPQQRVDTAIAILDVIRKNSMNGIAYNSQGTPNAESVLGVLSGSEAFLNWQEKNIEEFMIGKDKTLIRGQYRQFFNGVMNENKTTEKSET